MAPVGVALADWRTGGCTCVTLQNPNAGCCGSRALVVEGQRRGGGGWRAHAADCWLRLPVGRKLWVGSGRDGGGLLALW